MRLNKFLARAGISSRRKCDNFIALGKVVINGKVVKDFSYQVQDNDVIVCNGKPIVDIPKTKIYILNKLKGYISTSSDPSGRKKVIDLINSEDRLFTVGRLDRNTTGIILVTNDGMLANSLMHPSNKIERIYIVSTKIDVSKEKYSKVKEGIKIDTNITVSAKIYRLIKKGGLIYWKIYLYEGKNHEVKRIFKALGSAVVHLHRQSVAGLEIDKVPPGKYQTLQANEAKKLIEGIDN